MAYVIATDSGCDIAPAVLETWGVISADLTFRFDGEDKEYTNREMRPDDFYEKMKAGGVSRTSAVNSECFKDLFRPVLERGDDILYIGFDSGISATSEQGIAAAAELSEEYPNRQIIAIDTLCASGGQGLVVKLAVDRRKLGASLEETAAFVRTLSPSVATWFTVDDLMYLKRGGRVSAAAAIAGNLLNIRPVLHVDDGGKLINMLKVRGRKASLQALADQFFACGRGIDGQGALTDDVDYGSLGKGINGNSNVNALDSNAAGSNAAGHGSNGIPYVINHAAARKDAEALERIIAAKTGRRAEYIADVGPVIGSHTGPGIIVLSFPATER